MGDLRGFSGRLPVTGLRLRKVCCGGTSLTFLRLDDSGVFDREASRMNLASVFTSSGSKRPPGDCTGTDCEDVFFVGDVNVDIWAEESLSAE